MPHPVLHVCDKFGVSGSSIHGVSRLFAWWFPRYDRARYVPHLAGLKNEDEATRALRAEGVPARMLGRSAFDPRLIGDIGREIQRTRARILHVHGYAASNFGRIAARLARIPLVLHEHFADPKMPGYQKAPDLFLRDLTAQAIAVSQSTADFLIRDRFVPEDRVSVVFNGAPLDQFAPRPRDEGYALRAELGMPMDARVITTIGRLNAQKGHETLIAAAAFVVARVPGVRFLIVGDGDLLGSLKTQTHELGVSEAFVFAGHRKDVPEILAATDVLCISSNYEGTPLVLFEAMAAGKAIVSTAVDGCREVIHDQRTGLLVPPKDHEKLGAALAGVFADPSLKVRLEAGAQQASKRYDISECMRAMQQIYDDLLLRP
ncbi:MAG: glycosyltransferase [Vicinamibacteria bacterium]|nr:glycosyltransferase [Vicinamibacteria bacterium]